MILFLGNNTNRVYSYLYERYTVEHTEEKVSPKYLSKYERIISYGYRHLLTEEHIENAKHPIINLHISYLPWNRGADPNYWSWVENTPQGVTIHNIDKGIDTGDILVQQKVEFNSEETLASSYSKLKETIEYLFINNFEKIVSGKIKPVPQPEGGTVHYIKDFPGVDSWDIEVKDLVK